MTVAANLAHIFFAGSDKPGTVKPRAPRTKMNTSRSDEHGAELSPLIKSILLRAGIDPIAYREAPLQRRLPACLRIFRVSSPEQVEKILTEKPELLSRAVSALLIGASDFFRDPAVFRALLSNVIPDLLKTRSQLKILSAGCSEGQELYSAAMLLDQLGALHEAQLLGLDCRPDAVARASAGCFSQSHVLQLAPHLRKEHFLREDKGGYVISPALRAKTEFKTTNLLDYRYYCRFDVIFFRNLSIYLQPAAAGSLWRKLVLQLSPGGVVVTGKAERPPDGLPLTRLSTCIYRKDSASAHGT